MKKMITVLAMMVVMVASVFAGDRKTIDELVNNYEPVESMRIYPEMADEFASLFSDIIAAKDCYNTYNAEELANAIKNSTQYIAVIKECKNWIGYLVFDGETYYYFYIEDPIQITARDDMDWSKHLRSKNYYERVEKLGSLETETSFVLYKTKDWYGNVSFIMEPVYGTGL